VLVVVVIIVAVVESCLASRSTGAGARGQFGYTAEEERPPLKAVTTTLVKTQLTEDTSFCLTVIYEV
jgi:hypothetical protein